MTVNKTWRFSKYFRSYIRRTYAANEEVQLRVKSVFRHDADEVCPLLGYHAT
jgi:hypothetical protein